MPLTVRQYEDRTAPWDRHRRRVHTNGPGCHAWIMDDLLELLRAGLPAEALITDPDITASYAHDMASFCEAGTPAVVVLPGSVEEVQHVMRTATALRVPV